MKRHFNILLFGLLTGFTLLGSIVLAYMLLPEPFNILNNWVSNLGNPDINPIGEKFFNYGCILTAFFFLLFDLALCDIKTRSKRRKLILSIAELLGVASLSAMVGLALFHNNNPTITHMLFAGTVFFFASTFFLGTVYALKRFYVVKSLTVFYILFCIFLTVTLLAALLRVYLCEWIAIGMIILYLLYFSVTMFDYLFHSKRL